MGDLPPALEAARQRATRRRPRSLPQLRPAWETTPEATQPYALPRRALDDPNTVPYERRPTQQQVQQDRELERFARMHELNRNEVNTPPGTYFGQDTLEMTGAPALSRGMDALAAGDPGRALPEVAMGGASILGWGFGAHPTSRAPMRPPRLPEMPVETPTRPVARIERSNGTVMLHHPEGGGEFHRTVRSARESAERQGWDVNLPNEPPMPSFMRGEVADRLARQRRLTESNEAAARRMAEEQGLEHPPAMAGIPDYLAGWPGRGLNSSGMMDEAGRIDQGRFTADLLEGELGPYRIGGPYQDVPLMGTPEIGADPMARPTRPGFGQRPPTRTAPNEDRYLFGRPELPQPTPRLPNAPARLPGRATDGSVLPIRPPEPIRQSMVGGSDDLAEAAAMRPRAAPNVPDWIVRNPSEDDLARIAARGDEMKYVMDTDGNVYAFSAADGHHNQAMRALRDSGVSVRPLGPGAEVTDPDAAGFIWRNQDGTFTHEDANMVASGPYGSFQQRMRASQSPDGGASGAGRFGTPAPEEDQVLYYFGAEPGVAPYRQQYGDEVTQRIAGHNWTTETVRLDSLRGLQDSVSPTFRDVPAQGFDGKPPIIVRYRGQNYIENGTHRLVAAAERGDPNARVAVIDLDNGRAPDAPNAGTPRAPPPRTPPRPRPPRMQEDTLREIDDSAARVNFPAWPAPTRSYTLGELLDHPELYDIYPELRNFPVVVGDARLQGGRYGTAGFAEGDRLLIDPSQTSEFTGNKRLPSLRALIAHELQHVVDRLEGRVAQGGSPDWLRQNVILPDGVTPQQAYERLATEQTAFATERRIGLNAEQRMASEPFTESPLGYRKVPMLRSFLNAMRRGEMRQLEAYELSRPNVRTPERPPPRPRPPRRNQ